MLLALVRAHATTHPNRMAVIVGQERLTYAELERQTSRLIHHLRGRGIGRGCLVGVHLDRTPDVVVALLAVLGVGASYTIVEPTEPVTEGIGRLAVAGPDLVLTSPPYQEKLLRWGLRVLDVHEGENGKTPRFLTETEESDTAYVIYTSGSTGVPKGVMVSHANVRHYVESLLARLDVTEPLSYAHVTTLAADLGNTCLFLALWTGGTLHLVDDVTRRDPMGLLRYLQAEQIDVLKTTPSHWGAVLRAFGQDAATNPHLRLLLLGGELMTLPLARQILASGVTRTLVNHYGPTETTVGIAVHMLTCESDLHGLGDAASVPIGTALGATRLLIRTEDGRFHERDAVGELYVGGPSVTLGYRGDATATAEAFTNDLEGTTPGLGRIYRTGDKVRADRQGVLEFLDRGDRQVKIRGHRVELGHVEAGLRRLTAVADAVAVHLTRERPVLVAAVVTGNREVAAQPANLRQELREILPSYMIPDHIEIFDAFPRNSNGKVDLAMLRSLVEVRLADLTQRTHGVDDPILAEVCASWRRQLGHSDFGIHDEFDLVGGSSIDAIQVISDLQGKGYQVTAAMFLAEPTAAGLADRLRAGQVVGENDRDDRPATSPPVTDDTALAPAQEWFFRQDFAQPDQWNQALLLDIDSAVRPAELATAIDDVVGLHPMLHTAFRGAAAGCRREVVQIGPTFTTSALPDGKNEIVRHIQDIAAARQTEISVADGILFKAHLFLGREQAHLLLICHHLSIDAVSWRIIINDLSRCYSERLRGREPMTAFGTTDFGAWVTHLRDHAPALREGLAYWDDLPQINKGVPARPEAGGDNREGDAQAVWFRFSCAETDALAQAAASTGTPRHAVLLAAFAHALAELRGTDELVVDIESHGRTSFDDALDVSRVVGWFTSTFPVRIDVVAGDVDATSKTAATALDSVPNLGIAYGLYSQPQRADVCFNYLGPFVLPYEEDLRPTLSRYPVGPVRGAHNDRGYDLKLTARTHDGQLVADLSYTPQRHDPEQMLRLARATRSYVLKSAGIPLTKGQFVVEQGSSTGLLAQVPRALRCEPPASSPREYGTVLLTGATGFIGAHLLHLLLTRTEGKVHCLVRDREGESAADRLRDAYAWYLPGEELDQYADRISVLAGDLSEPRFALADEDHEMLCSEVEAIYHLAADTRLFGDRESFERHNTNPVRAMIDLTTTRRPKDLHYLSTLAVCGSGPEGEPTVFSEDSLNIGQRFLNEYERSKYDAERLIHEFTSRGGAGFIYRSGNVTGHSVSGRFQRNGRDSRLVQLLRACLGIGRVPRVGAQTLALSPVNIVVEGILEISRSAQVRGGTFHVDTHHQVSYDAIFTVLRELGCALEDDEAPDFAALLGRYIGESDEQVSLAHFWASRPERNIQYDHTRTRHLLTQLGVDFPPLGRAWLHKYFTGLIEKGEISLADDK